MSNQHLTTVREAIPEDEAAVQALLEHEGLASTFEPSEFIVAEGNQPSLPEARLPIADDRGCCILGCARLRAREGCLELSSVAVRPCCRGEGIGHALVQAALDDVREPVQALCLAPRFFGQLGFEEVEEIHPDLVEKAQGLCDDRDFIPMAWEPGVEP